MATNQSALAILVGSAFAASSLALLARRRLRRRRNPSGIADATLSEDERREAAEKLRESWGDSPRAEQTPNVEGQA